MATRTATTARLPGLAVPAIPFARVVPLLATAATAALILFAAYQLPVARHVAIADGGAAFSGFYDREQTPQFAYRWTGAVSAIRLLSLPSGMYTLDLGMVAPRPLGAPAPTVDLLVDGVAIEHVTVGPTYAHRAFTVRLPLSASGAHTLALHSQTFMEPAPSARALGILLTDVTLTPALEPLIPPLVPLLSFVGDVLLVYFLARARYAERLAFLATQTVAFLAILLLVLTHHPFDGPIEVALPLCAFLVAVAVLPGIVAHRTPAVVWLLGASVLILTSATIAGHALRSLVTTYWNPLDFHVYYDAARAVWAHHPQTMYHLDALAADPIKGANYRVPPLVGVLMAPLAAWPFPTALFVWRIMLITCAASGLALLATELRLAALGVPRGWPLVLLVLLTLLWLPLWQSIEAQFDSILLLLLVAAFIGLRRGWAPLAGGAIAVAGMIKLYPLYLVLFLIWKREWRALGWLAAALVALMGLGTLGTSWETTTRFVRDVLLRDGGGTLYAENQSLLAFFLRLFWIPEPYGPRVALLTVACFVLVTTPLCWRLRERAARTSTRYAMDFGLTIGAMLLAIPVAWQHYETILLIPIGVLLAALATSPPRPLRWKLWTGSALVVLALGGDVVLHRLLHLPLGPRSGVGKAIVISVPFFAQLGLLIGMWCVGTSKVTPHDSTAVGHSRLATRMTPSLETNGVLVAFENAVDRT